MALQRIPLFISSTFRDMHSERDFLRRVVFPELEERLRERGYHLDPIDLRWGLELPQDGGQESEERQILRLCLDEIDRSRPFFLGLIGDRYGWVPDGETMASAMDGVGLPLAPEPESVTALEMRYGVLASRQHTERSIFLFRELDVSEMAPDDRGFFSDKDAGLAHAADRLARLKEELRRVVPERVRTYTAQWDSERRRVTSLDAFGALLIDELWQMIAPELALRAETAGGWVARTERAHKRLAEELTLGFSGRADLVQRLRARYAAADASRAVCLVGESGGGASALMAHLVTQTQQENEGTLVLYHSADAADDPWDLQRVLRRWEVELGLVADHPEYAEAVAADTRSTAQLSDAVLKALASHEDPVLIVVDGFNQLREIAESFLLEAPGRLPAQVRLLVSSRAVINEPGWERVEIGGLDAETGAAMVQSLLTSAHKTLAPELMDALLVRGQGTATDGGLSPAWLRAAFEDLQSIGEQEFSRMGAEGVGVAAVNAMLLKRIHSLPTEVEKLLDRRISQMEDALGEGFVATVLKALVELRDPFPTRLFPVVCNGSAVPFSDVALVRLRRMLRAWLSASPEDGTWRIHSRALRDAIVARYLADEAERSWWHFELWQLLDPLPDPDVRRLEDWALWSSFERPQPLQRACIDGDLLTVRQYIREGYDLNADDSAWGPPLHVAVLWGTSEIVRELAAAGAYVNARYPEDGHSPLQWAFIRSRPAQVITALLDCGARLDVSGPQSLIHAAAASGSSSLVDTVLAHGADPLERVDGRYAHFAASLHSHWSLSNSLIDIIHERGGPQLTRLSPDELHWMAAALHGDVPALERLAPRVAVNCIDAAGRTALLCALQRQHYDAVEYLLHLGVEASIPDCNGITPLHHAVTCTDPRARDIVRRLLAAGAVTAAADRHSRTPLHWCAVVNVLDELGPHVELAKVLIEHSPDAAWWRDKDGNTFLDCFEESLHRMQAQSPEASDVNLVRDLRITVESTRSW